MVRFSSSNSKGAGNVRIEAEWPEGECSEYAYGPASFSAPLGCPSESVCSGIACPSEGVCGGLVVWYVVWVYSAEAK